MRKIKQKKVSESFQKLTAPSNLFDKRTSINMEDHIGEYFFIAIDKILPYPNQARKIFNEAELKNLADTISEYGVIQPLTVKKSDEQGFYYVISGERRLKAAKIAKLSKVPCIIIQNDHSSDYIALIENLQRVDLHPIEFGNACKNLINSTNIDQASIAKSLGVNKSKISETLAYSNLPDKVKDHLITKNITSRNILRKLIKTNSEEQIYKLLGLITKNNLKKKELIKILLEDEKITLFLYLDQINERQKKDLIINLKKILKMLEN